LENLVQNGFLGASFERFLKNFFGHDFFSMAPLEKSFKACTFGHFFGFSLQSYFRVCNMD
jgi:hypothetical protein